MPCLGGSVDRWLGPIINIGVFPGGLVTPPSAPTALIFPALIDTGAEITCVSPAIAVAVGLQTIGIREMTTALHAAPANMYLIELVLQFGTAMPWRRVMQAMEFRVDGTHHVQALIGRDVISQGTFVMSSTGHFSLCL